MSKPVNCMPPVHSGEILREDYLVPLGMSVNALAIALGVPATRIHEIVKERRSVTADTAERVARYFGGDAVSWLSLQAMYDVKTLATREEIINKVQPRTAEPVV
ncbi:MAG: HigA family addiction module antidote protein [Chloroflexi bacterium]|nr:HigA family addiction module antidote protein [Chloroflexota bacterium]